jgi:GrpB-like predicted nucleotidyltransferase (UPF0157 family)
VAVVPHSLQWKDLFQEEQERLRTAIGDRVVPIEHIGSTSVPGLDAKPVIDIAVAVRVIEDAADAIPLLESLGYLYRGELGLPGRHYFRRGDPTTHHLHIIEAHSHYWNQYIGFRDYLRLHPETAREYAVLKHQLAARYPNDREAYTTGKSAFITDVLSRFTAGATSSSEQ